MPIYLDDKKLVKRLLAGDEQAFNQFFDENFGRLYRFALARTSHDEDATREIVQAAMSQALRKIHRYRGESALFTWLCAITRNGIVDWMPGLLCCACFMLTIDAFAQTESSSYRGRPVHEVLEEFREGGMALVYSTNLVTDSLTMLEEPVSSDAVQVVIKILEPHGLTLNEVDGVYLVVRQEVRPGVEGRGTVLVIISNIDSLSTGGMVAIDSTPALPGVEMLSAGVYEFSNVTPGTYEIEIATAGYSSVRETFEIEVPVQGLASPDGTRAG